MQKKINPHFFQFSEIYFMIKPLNVSFYNQNLFHLIKDSPYKVTVILIEKNEILPENLKTYLGEKIIAELPTLLKDKRFSKTSIFHEKDNKLEKMILINAGNFKKYQNDDWLKCGGAVRAALETEETANIILHSRKTKIIEHFLKDFLQGFYLRDYKFQKYLYKKLTLERTSLKSVNFYLTTDLEEIECNGFAKDAFIISEAVANARDLVNEPGNVLTPDFFAEKIKDLKKYDLKITILDEKKLESLGLHALLGVGQGSSQKVKLAIIEWPGENKTDAPLAFVGKGITFDSGGISIKPSLKMEDMKGDMGGAAAVYGLMKILAQCKIKTRALGVIALAENMPGGNAQKPGDIIISGSKQTIEINNTDAEGRLVLADALWYTIENYKPRLIIDLATLTGAIIVALGTEYAGLFSNDNDLTNQLIKAGVQTGEKLWLLPLSDAYDKLIDSKFADMKNSGGRQAGSSTAAQFLQRFVKETPWAHLDIAGTASDVPLNEYNQSWATGFGVRLLNQFVFENFEKKS